MTHPSHTMTAARLDEELMHYLTSPNESLRMHLLARIERSPSRSIEPIKAWLGGTSCLEHRDSKPEPHQRGLM